ncbi:MAG: hypothetical protein B1H40_00555, partial [Candidatus Latescibacteria bacterium 4484_181]
MYDLVTFGEAMLRLSPPNFRRLEQTTNFDVQIGGAEMNVAVAASRLGLKTAFVTKLPRNPLGKMVENKNREQGVDTQHILWTDEGRVGIYYLEFGASPRASRVVYDRSGSAISTVRPGEIDWKRILGQTRLFHLSGITPALSPTAAETTLEALKTAREVNCLVSVDLNYRAKLWSQQQANKTMTKVMEYTDLLFTTEEDTQRVFGITADTYEEVAATLAERFSLETVAMSSDDRGTGELMGKVVELRKLVKIREDLRKKGLKVVFTNGCFDILHRGHIEYLKEAKQLGDVLIVGLNTDQSVRRVKGNRRPINCQEDR